MIRTTFSGQTMYPFQNENEANDFLKILKTFKGEILKIVKLNPKYIDPVYFIPEKDLFCVALFENGVEKTLFDNNGGIKMLHFKKQKKEPFFID